MRARPTCPPEGRGSRGLQGLPKARRVIVERREAALLSPNEPTQDGRGTEGNNVPASGLAASVTPLGTVRRGTTLAEPISQHHVFCGRA